MVELFPDQEELVRDVFLYRKKVSWDQWSHDIKGIAQQAPFRYMYTPGGKRLNISMTNCGELGWVSDQKGYRYQSADPTSGQQWPNIPESFRALGQSVAHAAGFDHFSPNACLINHYQAGQKLSAHQDKNEPDLTQPVVSVSLGMSATFLIHGNSRNNRAQKIQLHDGDVMVWGRSARLMYHGVKTKQAQPHPTLGFHRFNVTLRQV